MHLLSFPSEESDHEVTRGTNEPEDWQISACSRVPEVKPRLTS